MGDRQPGTARVNSSKSNGVDGGVNVQVILRCRPPSKEEIAQRTPQVVKCVEAAREVTLLQNQGGKSLGRTYHFDKVFPGDTSQEKLYVAAVAPIVDEVLEGFNCTIFAYGQTGTGKTYTMQGGDDSSAELSAAAGVIPRAVHQIFCYLDSINSEYTVKCSFLELYNEEITDLLVLGNDTPKVRILEDRSGVVLHGLEEMHVKSASDIFQLLDQGSAKRRTAETLLNKQSSRSHSVFTVTVSIREILAEGEEVIRVGKLYLVDLAGSENISRSGAIDQRAKEAGNINKSLLTLGRVITALVEGQGHVPYRDSKLTRLLRDSLGGKTKTCIIATIAPTVQCQEETLSTLDYAHRAKNIKNKPEVNQKISKTTHLKELNTEIEKLKQELFATREKNGVYLPIKQYEAECEERRQLAARVEFLEQEAERLAEQHESDKQLLQRQAEMQRQTYESQLKRVRTELADTQEALRLARVAIEERDFLIATQQHCEASIAEHASSLTAQLHAAAADISLLFQRVDQKNVMEDNNQALVQEVKAAVVQRLAAIEGAVAAAATSQAQRFAEGAATLQALLERKRSDAARLRQQMTVLQGQLVAMGSTASNAAVALHESGAAGIQAINALHTDYVTAAKAAAEEAAGAVAAAYSALADSMTMEQQQLSSFTKQQCAAVDAVYGATQSIVLAMREQLQAAQAQAITMQADAAARLNKQAASVSEFEDAFLAKTKTEQAVLMDKIAAMLTGFVSQTEQQVKDAVCGLKGQIAADEQALGAQLAAMEATAQASVQSLQDKEASAGKAHTAASDALQQGSASLAAAMEVTVGQGQSLLAGVQQHAKAASQQLEEHAGVVAAGVQQQVQGMAELRDAQQQLCSTVLATAAQTRKTVEDDAVADFSKDEGMAQQLVELNTEGAALLKDFAVEQQAAISGLSADVQSRIDVEYQQDADRGNVPHQRERQLPSAADLDAMRTPPVDEVLEAFREQKAADAEQQQDGAEPSAVEPGEQEASTVLCDDDGQAEAGQENVNQGNVAPLDVDLPHIKTQKAVSPIPAGNKRTREMCTPLSARPTPSKLRNAFERHTSQLKN